jgi:zinc transporter ZupT
MEVYVLYGLLAGVITFAAGVLPFYIDFKGIRYIIAASAGVVIATVFLDLLPEANLERDAYLVAFGFLLFYLVGKLTVLHSCGEMECSEHRINMASIFGMALDNVIDGIAITVSYFISPHTALVVTIAVILHEIPQDITATLIMKGYGYSIKKMLLPVIFAAVAYPVGSSAAVFIPEGLHQPIIAFVSGTFIYIGVGDLLTEAHRKFNIKVILSVLLGFVIVFALGTLPGH